MKSIVFFVVLCLSVAFPVWANPSPVLVFPTSDSVEEYARELPPGVSISSDPAKSTTGKPVLKIVYDVSEPQFVPLVHVPSRWKWSGWVGLHYTAQVCADDPTGWANIQMRWRFLGGTDAWCGGSEQQCNRTQWGESKSFLGLPLKMDLIEVVLGVRVKGKGTLWLEDARLAEEQSTRMTALPGWIIGVIGGTAGSLLGIWGAVIGVLAAKCRAKRLVLHGSVASIGLGIVLLIGGVVLYFVGAHNTYWYPCGLMGAIMAGVFGGNLPSLRRRYAAAELERLNAKDASEGI